MDERRSPDPVRYPAIIRAIMGPPSSASFFGSSFRRLSDDEAASLFEHIRQRVRRIIVALSAGIASTILGMVLSIWSAISSSRDTASIKEQAAQLNANASADRAKIADIGHLATELDQRLRIVDDIRSAGEDLVAQQRSLEEAASNLTNGTKTAHADSLETLVLETRRTVADLRDHIEQLGLTKAQQDIERVLNELYPRLADDYVLQLVNMSRDLAQTSKDRVNSVKATLGIDLSGSPISQQYTQAIANLTSAVDAVEATGSPPSAREQRILLGSAIHRSTTVVSVGEILVRQMISDYTGRIAEQNAEKLRTVMTASK